MNNKLAAQIQKNAILRKSYWFVRQISRANDRRRASLEDYARWHPIFVNSFPKSGTHLLLQVLQGVPGVIYYDSFLASMPPMPHKERSFQNHIKRLRHIAPGEILPGHLFYHPAYHQELVRKSVLTFFIYRDPRDVTISEAYYLTNMARWHGLHSYFAKRLTTMEERISASIVGINEADFPIDYPDISQRFQRYKGWLECADVFPVRFEDLVGVQRDATIQQVAQHLVAVGQYDIAPNKLAGQLLSYIDPQKSRTFRKGKTEQWREIYTEKHTEQFKLVSGDLLIDLGYEQDSNW